MQKINGIELKIPETISDKKWYSAIKTLIDKVDYGNLEIKMTIKKCTVMNIKVKSEKSISIHND